MRPGTQVILPLVNKGNPSLKLKLLTVVDHIQTDGWMNPAQDYDYDLKLSGGHRAHWSHVYSIPEGVEPTQDMLDTIAQECPQWILLLEYTGSEIRKYVHDALCRCITYDLPTLIKKVQKGLSVHVWVDNDTVGFYWDEGCEHPVPNVAGDNPEYLLVEVLNALGFKARHV